MGKYIMFAATQRNCGLIRADSGEWLNTKYIVYSDGTCWTVSTYDEDPYNRSILSGILSEQERCELNYPKSFLMKTEMFEELKILLENEFDKTTAATGCDGVQWEMHHYAPGGRLLHSVFGFADGVFCLKRMTEILQEK